MADKPIMPGDTITLKAKDKETDRPKTRTVKISKTT